MTLSRRHTYLIALALLLSTALLASSAHHANHANRVHSTSTDASMASAASTALDSVGWDTLARNDSLRDAEAAYRACAREAVLFHLPLTDFPDVSERVTYFTQDGKRLKKSESMRINIDDMQIDNGCAVHVVKSISVDIVSSDAQAHLTIDETGRSVAYQSSHQSSGNSSSGSLPPGEARLQRAIARKALPTPTCTFTRDAGPQSHFMMLSLCRNEERRAELKQQQPQERQVEPRRRPAASSALVKSS
jgi:hypothetical protein